MPHLDSVCRPVSELELLGYDMVLVVAQSSSRPLYLHSTDICSYPPLFSPCDLMASGFHDKCSSQQGAKYEVAGRHDYVLLEILNMRR